MHTIMADENIPLAQDAMQRFGTVTTFHGRQLRQADLQHAEILLVRSITRVDHSLLDSTPVRFVGTATIGTDHIDQAYLAERGIAFASAAGCNANSVAEYVIAAILELHAMGLLPPPQTLSLGIVGVGHVGSRLAEKAEALGISLLLNDPPRQRREGGDQWCSFESLLAEADIISFHVPLHRSGIDSTLHLLNRANLPTIKPTAVVINSARGPVIDNAALAEWLITHPKAAAVLDVWETEPAFSTALARLCTFATPHIAGYSQDGKLEGTRMMHAAVAANLGTQPSWSPPIPPVVPLTRTLTTQEAALPLHALARILLRERYRLEDDHQRFKELFSMDDQARAQAFDALRKSYPDRWEWRHTTLLPPEVTDESSARKWRALQKLGFIVAGS